ncbi:unnamed protein product [Caretta caretta]
MHLILDPGQSVQYLAGWHPHAQMRPRKSQTSTRTRCFRGWDNVGPALARICPSPSPYINYGSKPLQSPNPLEHQPLLADQVSGSSDLKQRTASTQNPFIVGGHFPNYYPCQGRGAVNQAPSPIPNTTSQIRWVN